MKTGRAIPTGMLMLAVVVEGYGRTRMMPAGDCVWVELQSTTAVTPAALKIAKDTAARLFSPTGVNVAFASFSAPADSCPTIRVQFEQFTWPSFHPGALAYAQPYREMGTEIHILADRVLRGEATTDGKVLGHVLAHEIGHVLESVSRHSASGVMKAHWTDADRTEMATHLLEFAPEDVELIHAGFAWRKSQANAGVASTH